MSMLTIWEVPGIKRIGAELQSTPSHVAAAWELATDVGLAWGRMLQTGNPIHRPQCVRRERAIDLCVGRVGIGRGDLTTIDTRRL